MESITLPISCNDRHCWTGGLPTVVDAIPYLQGDRSRTAKVKLSCAALALFRDQVDALLRLFYAREFGRNLA